MWPNRLFTNCVIIRIIFNYNYYNDTLVFEWPNRPAWTCTSSDVISFGRLRHSFRNFILRISFFRYLQSYIVLRRVSLSAMLSHKHHGTRLLLLFRHLYLHYIAACYQVSGLWSYGGVFCCLAAEAQPERSGARPRQKKIKKGKEEGEKKEREGKKDIKRGRESEREGATSSFRICFNF